MSMTALDPEHPFVKQWAAMCEDRALADLPYKMETNGAGKIIMSPPSNWHAFYQFKIGYILQPLMPSGEVLGECGVQTSDGIKVPDTVWISAERFTAYCDEVCFPIAPEICVEVASPSNSRKDMLEKKQLYFAAGANEVWFCDRNGDLTFFSNEDEENPTSFSKLCPAFPVSIKKAA